MFNVAGIGVQFQTETLFNLSGQLCLRDGISCIPPSKLRDLHSGATETSVNIFSKIPT